MKGLRFLLLSMVVVTLIWSCGKTEEAPIVSQNDTVAEEPADDIYQFKVVDGQGDSVSLSIYRGQVLLVVNTATQCGYTPQYTDLQRIYELYHDEGFEILDFPCNQFGGQAPGSYDDIHDFCTDHYGITFTQFGKIYVNGVLTAPLYKWLKTKKPGDIQWNFTKFLIDREGNVVRRFEPDDRMALVESSVRNQL